MKIARISVYQVERSLEHPYRVPGGRSQVETRDAAFVDVAPDPGEIGRGKGTPWGHTYMPALGTPPDQDRLGDARAVYT